MKLHIKNIILITMLAFVTIGGTTSCGSKKKLAKKEYEAKLLQAKTDLNAIIEGTTQWTLEEQKSRIEEIEKSDLQNAEIDALVVKAKEVVEQNKVKPVTSLEDYFTIIAAAPNAETANAKIAEALKLFASPDVPVLIIVYHVGDIIDYDAPTTAERYLNYIKDQKKVAVGIYNIKYDGNNKITELELIKK